MPYDATRPSLILMRLILVATTFSYGILRLLYDDRSPMFMLAPGDPGHDVMPYVTNPVWAQGMVVTLTMLCGFIAGQTLWIGFKESFYERMQAPTERQIALVDGEIAKRAANAASAFVGNVGDKITIKVTVERIIVLPDYGFGVNYINLLRDEAGNVLVYKGLSDIGQQGEAVMLKATVKAHDMRDGVCQTTIQRPKVLEVA